MAFYKYTEYKPGSEGGPIRTGACWWLASRTTKVPWQWWNNEWLWEIDEDVYDWLALVAWKEIDANYWQKRAQKRGQLLTGFHRWAALWANPRFGQNNRLSEGGGGEGGPGNKKEFSRICKLKRNQIEWKKCRQLSNQGMPIVPRKDKRRDFWLNNLHLNHGTQGGRFPLLLQKNWNHKKKIIFYKKNHSTKESAF